MVDDVRVAVVGEGAGNGFLPFQFGGGDGTPLAHGVSDFHGIVAEDASGWDAAELVAACGLRSWSFHHVPTSQKLFQPHRRAVWPCPWMDLSAGFEAYAARLRGAGSTVVAKLAAAERRMERDLGPLRFEAHTSDAAVLRALMRWKSAQYRAWGAKDRFAEGWELDLLRRLLEVQTPDFAGTLSALFAGDELLAAHLGMRSLHNWHYWFPAYDPRFARYSPGLVLLLRMAQWAPAAGLRRIDLGKGEEPYKRRLGSAESSVASGRVVASRR